MGIKFQRAKLITTKSGNRMITTVQTYSDANNPPPMPLIGITKCVDSGNAKKQSMPYAENVSTALGTMTQYKTLWVPVGQEGWKINIQCTLKYRPPTIYTPYDSKYDEIANWQTIDTGQLLVVESNQCDPLGRHSTKQPPYARLDPQSLWYVDKITIRTLKGIANMAQMELVLIRCWT